MDIFGGLTGNPNKGFFWKNYDLYMFEYLVVIQGVPKFSLPTSAGRFLHQTKNKFIYSFSVIA